MKKIYLTVLTFAAMFFAVDSDDESLNGFYVEATYDFNF